MEEVWKALTDPTELTRWHPLEARVAPGKIEVQAWLSAFSLPPSPVEAFGKKWEQRLHESFPNG